MSDNHWSSCALHSGPARFPAPCDCGGIQPGGRFIRLRNTLALWRARVAWKSENRAGVVEFFRRLAGDDG
jgi:hypothetical protein